MCVNWPHENESCCWLTRYEILPVGDWFIFDRWSLACKSYLLTLLGQKKQQYTQQLNRSLATTATVTKAKFLTKKPTSITEAENPALDDTEPVSHRWPAFVSEWNLVEDVLLLRQNYRNSLSQTVYNYAFPLWQHCSEGFLDVHLWWHYMIALPLNLILPNGIKAVLSPSQATLKPNFCFVDDEKVKLVGVIKYLWHQLASGPADTPGSCTAVWLHGIIQLSLWCSYDLHLYVVCQAIQRQGWAAD